MNRVVSVDIETTGLDPQRHEAWEIALVPLEPREGESSRFLYHMPTTLLGAEPKALAVGNYFERYPEPAPAPGYAYMYYFEEDAADGEAGYETIPVSEAVSFIAETLEGASPLGAAVHFDMNFLWALMEREEFQRPSWHHRYLDLGSYAAGALAAKRALSTNALAERIPNPNAHSALADAEWNIAVYRSILDR